MCILRLTPYIWAIITAIYKQLFCLWKRWFICLRLGKIVKCCWLSLADSVSGHVSFFETSSLFGTSSFTSDKHQSLTSNISVHIWIKILSWKTFVTVWPDNGVTWGMMFGAKTHRMLVEQCKRTPIWLGYVDDISMSLMSS